MAKKPFSIRVESHVTNKYRALSTVLNIDGASLLSELIFEKEQKLNDDELKAYEALLRIWKED